MRDLLKRSRKQTCPFSKDFTMAPEQKKKDNKPTAVQGPRLERIPQPSTVPVVGNLTSLDLEGPSRSFAQLASRYGSIYRLSFPGQDLIVVSSWRLVNEACDDSRFKKSIQGDLEELRNVALQQSVKGDSPPLEFFVENKAPAAEENTAPGLWLNFGEIPRMRAPPGDTSSTAAFDTLRHWVSRCKAEHTQCKPAADSLKTLPDRVLEIESTEPLRVRLVENCTLRADYACLSHRWGPQTRPNSLVKDNLDLYKAEVPEDKLYPLVRDAIVAVIKLDINIRFIWIDCYCIIQDDPGDWEVQAAKMGRIYENALLTISATFSEEGRGIFSTTPSEFEAFPITEIGGEPVYIRKPLPHPCAIDVSGQEQLHGLSLTRAWVFQERLLSNRFIHFTSSEIFWECRESTWCECDSGKSKWEGHRRAGPRTILDQAWDTIAEQYNEMQLSFEKDRLPAIAGIAQRHAELRGGWTYLAGLWRENLPSALAWRKSECDEPRPLEQFAPTWSWASLPRGRELTTAPTWTWASLPVVGEPTGGPITDSAGSMRLVRYEINPAAADAYTGARWTEITVEGFTLDLTVYNESDGGLVGRHEDVFLEMRADFKTDPDDDTKFRAVPDGSRCLLLLLFDDGKTDDWADLFGIVLMQKSSGAGAGGAKFERIGCFDFGSGSYVDDTGIYDEYCGGSFLHFTYGNPVYVANPAPFQWVLDKAKTRQVTLV
ncbi:hypothetical protein INS49_013551 [Diaporthe citri]|uniref:uncharacterized protein n=1 Tax=Diaporthe citri TaxID=83186 RepID=UPI001C7ED2A9|nr:uncharacterized protein INS49_013551 [Diaporthe citri]KAG6357672.1 hypothetical protein INS49_013551 [Diaporthe citri]